MQTEIAADIAAIEAISSVPTILEAVAAITGLRFVCIARVSADAWTTCAVLDRLGFGLKAGDGLDLATTLCQEVRDSGRPVIIDNVSADARYRDHHTPRIYGFQSYISLPIQRADGSYFGTLCGLDPLPADLSNTATVASMGLFAQLISKHLESELKLSESQSALLSERDTSELREQFIAVLGHDLRTPLSSILLGAELLKREPLSAQAAGVVERMRRSALRMSTLVNDVMDFTRGRMGGGIALNLHSDAGLQQSLEQVVAELQGAYPEHRIAQDIDVPGCVYCDSGRIQQLLSNLLKNALVHGAREEAVLVRAIARGGELEISVANGGPAIAPATIGQLFKPFWRAAGHAASEGLGLGLFIVSEIARSHGGTLEVTSENGATRFTFRMRAGEPVERRTVVRA
ncbi:GAF domain-containing sensor histidine kinase [Massilia sp. DJPM01]|uniref:GAF domain-containing sensor histidine kinase n=1 Tax=Massilia sp. DJPM01 TaxID=3024404 RepID=UPI00259F3038|nr:GAF domain-containing sensor histidine kinase [Massilia sp. DJPM01]MDM5178290.1 GAF domain-containing sensor histidine kinase [Massilia sp. DJPM01]